MSSFEIKGRGNIHKSSTSQRAKSIQRNESSPDSDESITTESEPELDCNEIDNNRTIKEESLSPEGCRVDLKVSASIINDKPDSKIPIYWKLLPIVLVIGICLNKCMHSETHKCSFEDIQKQYPNENNLMWNTLRIGIELILNNNHNRKPAVYLFAHHGRGSASQLIKDVAEHSSNCFGKKLVPMESNDFIATPDDYGYAIEKYKNKIKDGNVILIANIDKIPPKAARALHSICDTHSPINQKAVIFLTLTLSVNKADSATALAEETLQELWGSTLARNELDPLITRVTDEVILLQS